MRKYTAALLAAALTFSGCNNNTESPFKPEVTTYGYVDEEDGFAVELTETVWLEEDRMACLEAQIRSLSEDREVVGEYGIILPWISNVKELHLGEWQSLRSFGIEDYPGGMLVVVDLETWHEDRTYTYETALFMCNGRELKDITPYDSEGDPPVLSSNTYDVGESPDELVFGFTDTDENKRRFELDFENLTMAEIN